MAILFLAVGGMLVPSGMASAHWLRGRLTRCRPCCVTETATPRTPGYGDKLTLTSNTVTIKGNLFYQDCVTAVGSVIGFTDTVRIEAWATTAAPDDTRVTCTGSLTGLTSNFSFTIDPSTLPANKYVTLKFFMSTNMTTTPDRFVQGVNTMATRTQVIHMGMPLQRGTAGTTPPTSVITNLPNPPNYFTKNDGITPLSPADTVSVSAQDFNGMSVFPNAGSISNYQNYSLSFSSSKIAPADKTLKLTFTRNLTQWQATGIVGGNTKYPAAMVLDIAFP